MPPRQRALSKSCAFNLTAYFLISIMVVFAVCLLYYYARLAPDATPLERAKWAEAKYARCLFVLPDFSHQLACLQSPHDGAEVLEQLETNASQRAARFKVWDFFDNKLGIEHRIGNLERP